MNPTGSVTSWLRSMEAGQDDAAHHLWRRFEGPLHLVAKRRMSRLRNRDVVDEEDIVISAFASICLAARKGQLTNVRNRNELWALLTVAVCNKVGQREEYTAAARRDLARTKRAADHREGSGSFLERLSVDLPGPESAAIQSEAVHDLLAMLDDPEHQAVAVLRMQGFTNREIAAELGYSQRTIQRILNVIRTTWSEATCDHLTDSAPASE